MQDNMGIGEKEFAVIREISNNNKPTQRHIAKKAGISLGLTNLIIKRLIKKGYIKIHEAPPQTIIYILTPKGLVEKTKKSYHYSLKTINSMKIIRENIQDIIINLYNQGGRIFVISGNEELATLAEIALNGLNLKDISFTRNKAKSDKNDPTCNLLVNINNLEKKVDILSDLSKREVYY